MCVAAAATCWLSAAQRCAFKLERSRLHSAAEIDEERLCGGRASCTRPVGVSCLAMSGGIEVLDDGLAGQCAIPRTARDCCPVRTVRDGSMPAWC